jgi:iron complex transport system permease protein
MRQKYRCRVLSSTTGVLIALGVAFLIIFVLSLGLGKYAVPAKDVLNILAGKLFGLEIIASPVAVDVVINIRLLRILAAAMIGGALSMAGATYQGLFRNPIVSPDLLGASSGAGFGAAIALISSLNLFLVSIISFFTGIGAVFSAYVISTLIGRRHANDLLTLVLTGMVVASLFTAFTSLIKLTADPDSKLPAITYWLMGGLSTIIPQNLFMLLGSLLLGMIPLFLFSWRINLMVFEDEEARSMGMDVKKYRVIFIVCATLLTTASVAVSGVIGWVGLVIPHIARLLVGPNYKKMMPVSLLLGASFLILVDDITRCAFSSEIPLGIITSIVGAPFFILLMLQKRGVRNEA